MKSRSLAGKTALVTGANTGIGRVTAIELAKLGAEVVLGCRSLERTEPVLAEIAALPQAGKARFLKLDLGSLAQVRAAAQELVDAGQPIDFLINNAGLAGQRGLTQDGFELTFGTNHLGPFLFTHMLLPLVLKSEEKRIVNVASTAHYKVKKLSYEGVRKPTAHTTGLPEYELSKLANVMFSLELHRRYNAEGLQSFSLHPGVVASDVWRSVPWPFRNLMKLFMITNEQGAKTTLLCALSDEAKSGKYYDQEKLRPASELATEENARDLWSRSEAWCGLGKSAT
jgi:retinol dehydrogenase 12